MPDQNGSGSTRAGLTQGQASGTSHDSGRDGTQRQVRVRIAPSPTGDPHVGLAYATLFNYAFVKRNGGKLVLRIEDTDRARSKPYSERLIMEALRWLGLEWDEGPDIGGPYGPYRQSERFAIYIEHAKKLLASGHAYTCFCTSERLDQLRAAQKQSGGKFGYDRRCRSLAADEVGRRQSAGEPYVIRLAVPTEGKVDFVDCVRGRLEFDVDMIDDQILLKSDGFPTYHLANVVDDTLMRITHVIRAEEWISSTPKHVLLYRAFGWEPPSFAHLPLLRQADRSKISKRRNPVSLNYYRRAGILPRAMINFLALMGWGFGDDTEIFSLGQMLERFELKDIHLGGPIFDLTKLAWLNQHYVQRMDAGEFADYLRSEFFSREYLMAIHPLMVERIPTFDQFVDRAAFFFNGALSYEGLPIVPKTRTVPELAGMVAELTELLDELPEWTVAAVHATLEDLLKRLGWKGKEYYMPLRLLVTGRADSPPLVETIVTLGREMIRFRLRNALDTALKVNVETSIK